MDVPWLPSVYDTRVGFSDWLAADIQCLVDKTK